MAECARFQRQLESERNSLKELQGKYEENSKRKEYELLQDQVRDGYNLFVLPNRSKNVQNWGIKKIKCLMFFNF